MPQRMHAAGVQPVRGAGTSALRWMRRSAKFEPVFQRLQRFVPAALRLKTMARTGCAEMKIISPADLA